MEDSFLYESDQLLYLRLNDARTSSHLTITSLIVRNSIRFFSLRDDSFGIEDSSKPTAGAQEIYE